MEQAPVTKVLYSLREVQEITGLSRSTLYQLITAKRLTARKVGARTVVTADDLRRFVSGLKVA